MTANTEHSKTRLQQLPPTLSDLLVRLDLCRQSGKGEFGPGTARIPVGNYRNTERWKDEQDHLFGALPIVSAHGSELTMGSVLEGSARKIKPAPAKAPSGTHPPDGSSASDDQPRHSNVQ